MNERARWRHRRVLYSVLVGLLVFAVLMQVYVRIAAWACQHYAVTRYVVVSQQLDDETSSRISRWLGKIQAAGELSQPVYADLTATLLRKFPLVGSVSWARYNPVCLTCTVVGVLPVFGVNYESVAGTNGRLYSPAVIGDVPIDLPMVMVGREWLEGDYFKQVFDFISELSASILSTFECTYHNPYMIVMTPKESLDLPHRCVCIIDERTVSLLPDSVALMSLCQGHEDHICLFDFRFSGRVVSKHITETERIQLQRV